MVKFTRLRLKVRKVDCVSDTVFIILNLDATCTFPLYFYKCKPSSTLLKVYPTLRKKIYKRIKKFTERFKPVPLGN